MANTTNGSTKATNPDKGPNQGERNAYRRIELINQTKNKTTGRYYAWSVPFPVTRVASEYVPAFFWVSQESLNHNKSFPRDSLIPLRRRDDKLIFRRDNS